ncbi:MAG: class I SAM-dependent methyltransferase, partial [Pseudomonadota bacterium]
MSSTAANDSDRRDHYLPGVREQYEALPYPPRPPQDERQRLKLVPTDHLPIIADRCFGGRRDLGFTGMRALVAGGGTGDSTIYLAEQLRDTASEVVHLDLSLASIDVARRRASVRGLQNVRFVHASLLDAQRELDGTFDYINCSGVLHHLEDPDAGLKVLRGLLTPTGAMGLMVYGRYGRTAHYQIQTLMRMVNLATDDPAEKLANLESTLASLHPHHWLHFSQRVAPTHDAAGTLGDAGRYDLFLHEQDRAYSIGEVYDWMAANELYIPGPPGNPTTRFLYDPSTYVQDPQFLAHLDTLPEATRYAIGELLYGHIGRHIFYATTTPDSQATLDDADLCPTWVDDGGLGVKAKLTHQDESQLVIEHG